MFLPQFILIATQTNLALMFVVLGILIVGFGYGALLKTKERLKLHRWSMSVATILASVSILFVMLPTAYNFFIDPNFVLASSLTLIIFVHAVIGVPAITFAIIYALGDLPQKTKAWMRWAAVFWAASFSIGFIMFLNLTDYLLF